MEQYLKMSDHQKEVEQGQRFEFGANWTQFLSLLDDQRIERAEHSLQESLGLDSLQGLRLLDAGSGSGLFSLAARRLGADVHSFDYDPHSVACTTELKRRYFDADSHWKVEQASVLDQEYLAALGTFDVVYSWGVLHHTGQLWQALENVHSRVAANGRLFISIYNDQGGKSRRWLLVKRAYNLLPRGLRWLVWLPVLIKVWAAECVRDLLRGRPFQSWMRYSKAGARGMSPFRDLIDWAGGLPFEVAKPEQIFDFYHQRGYSLERMKTCGGGLGCNEFVFKKNRA